LRAHFSGSVIYFLVWIIIIPKVPSAWRIKMRRLMSFMSGAVMGVLVGSTLALLLAPASGDELRLKMQEQVQQIQNEIKAAGEARRAEMEAQLAELRSPQKSE
jgi:gas vesicle protein